MDRRLSMNRRKSRLDTAPKVVEAQLDCFSAIREGNITFITKLLDDPDCKIEKTRWSGWTMLHRAAEEGQTDICKLLLERGAKVNARTTWGWFTPLHLALSNGWRETALVLQEKGADITARSKCQRDPFQYAIHKGFRKLSEDFRYQILLKEEIRVRDLLRLKGNGD